MNFKSSAALLTQVQRLTGGANKKEVTEEEEDEVLVDQKKRLLRRRLRTWSKMGVFLLVWLAFTVAFMLKHEHEEEQKIIIVPSEATLDEVLAADPQRKLIGVTLGGHFLPPASQGEYQPVGTPKLHVQVQRIEYDDAGNIKSTKSVSEEWELALLPLAETKHVHMMTRIFELTPTGEKQEKTKLQLHFSTSDFKESVSLQLSVNDKPIDKDVGVICATFVLVFLYVLIIWEIVDRTFAAIMASTAALGVLCYLNARPSMETIMGWINYETLLLLFGMMVLVSILSDSGVFDYLAVLAFQITKGRFWPLITCLCLFTGFLSAFLDNVTMVLLMTPVTIRLCEVMGLRTTPVLISMVIYSNIGGTMTAVGDPPNVIIASNSYMIRNGMDFFTFFMHIAPCVLLIMVFTYLMLRLLFRSKSSTHLNGAEGLDNLRRSIATWHRTANVLTPYSHQEEVIRDQLLDTVKDLKHKMREQRKSVPDVERNKEYEETLNSLRDRYPIHNKTLLIKSVIALVFVIFLFCQSFLPITLDWAALLGAILLLILANKINLERVMDQIEWSTLIFFAALFILMEAVALMGLIDWIGDVIIQIVDSVHEKSRLAVALLIVLWVSALASAVVDNIPITTMMIKLLITLDQSKKVQLPLLPLVWALALGVCLGGNGTLIGASANVVCAGVANHHGYSFTFMDFLKIGFPIMICSIIVASIYLMVAHVAFEWH